MLTAVCDVDLGHRSDREGAFVGGGPWTNLNRKSIAEDIKTPAAKTACKAATHRDVSDVILTK